MPRRRLICASLAAVAAILWASSALAPLAAAPQTPQAPDQAPVFRSGADLVRVDVTVTSSDGTPVADLSQDDFEVLEDGQPQPIERFNLVTLDGARGTSDDTSLDIRSDEHGRNEAGREDVRLFAIFLDDYHIERQAETIRVREAIVPFVRDGFAPTDLLTLMDPLTPLSALHFTRDREDLARRVQVFEGRRGIYHPVRSALEEEQLRGPNIERTRAEVTLSALKALVTHLGSIRDGRKAVLFVSGGFPDSLDRWITARDVYEAASQNNTAIYTLDPGGLGSRGFGDLGLMRSLAENSGGRAFVNMNEFDHSLGQIVRDASAYYLIGYAPRHTEADGRFHQIKVRVKRRGADVRFRRGYWAPTADEAKRAANMPPPPSEKIAQAFSTLSSSSSGRTIDTWIGLARGAAGLTRLTVAWEPRAARAEQIATKAARVVVAALDASGHEQFRGEAVTVPASAASAAGADISGQVAFDLPPGPTTLRLEVSNPDGEPMDLDVRKMDVPDLWKAGALLGTPHVILAHNGRQFRDMLASAAPPRSPRREFRRTDMLIIRFAAYDQDGGAPAVAAKLVTKAGASLVTLPVGRLEGQDATHQIELPLASLAMGDYLVRIESAVNETSAVELIPLRIGP